VTGRMAGYLCSPDKTDGDNWTATSFLYGEMPLLSPSRHCQNTELASNKNKLAVEPKSGPINPPRDRLEAGIPSRYVTSQLRQLSLASLRGR